ncbi:MFS hexose transporter [Ilyonectria robusta]|uniref:MFS hexose transporter n=1 Tax=Ilyonectria robusta TaxID=1079257 RepID=UPI001E8C9D86|nr:MFS hexose transporter [Ilyonectria robusta]KAH8651467.1 MFS hexose transporter [Ilyonectria robusta]
MDLEKKPSTAEQAEKVTNDKELAQIGNQEEHSIGKRESFRRYPKACAWALFAIWYVLLVSFENQASGNILGIPRFREDFGYLHDGKYVLHANWQSAFSGAPMASAIIGCLGGGYLADKFGRKPVLISTLVVSYAAITMEFVATTNELFFGGKFLNGFGTGCIATVCVSYIGEIAPLAFRGIFTCLVGFSYTLGPLVSALIVKYTGTLPDRWAYRSVFCAQFGFAAVATPFVLTMPESPWWLMSKDRAEAALHSLNRLGYREGEGHVRLSVIQQTLEKIKAETEGVTYLECFRATNLRRTCISVAPKCMQAFSGITFAASYATYYMQLAGYSTEKSFTLQIIQQVVSMIGSVMSWYLVDRIGRRNLTFYGLLSLTVILLVMGGCATATTNPMAIEATVAFILLYCWMYNVSIGAVAFTVLAEVSTSRLRAKTVGIGLAVVNGLNMMWSFVLPYLFNPDKANLGAKVAFIFGGCSVLSLVYLWFELPETAGRTYEELDEMFMKKIPARQFKAYKTETEHSQDIKEID